MPQWFQDARFGAFIHWGVYPVPPCIHTNREDSVHDCNAEWHQVLTMAKPGPSRQFHDRVRVYGKDSACRDSAPVPGRTLEPRRVGAALQGCRGQAPGELPIQYAYLFSVAGLAPLK